MSFDSAIGDVYSSPTRGSRNGSTTAAAAAAAASAVTAAAAASQLVAADDGLDREYYDLTTATSEEASAAIFRATTPPSFSAAPPDEASAADAAVHDVISFDIVNLGDDEFGFRLPDNTVVDSDGNHRHKGEFTFFKMSLFYWNHIDRTGWYAKTFFCNPDELEFISLHFFCVYHLLLQFCWIF